MLTKINKILAVVLDWAIGIIMTATVVILFIGVILRYLFNAPLFWSEEITVLGLIWMTFLGGAILVRQDKNVCITVFCDLCRAPTVRWIRIVSDILVVAILLVMIYQSYNLTGRLAFSTTPAIRLEESWYGWALVVGFIGMLWYQVQRLVALIRNKPAFPETADRDGRCAL